MRRLTVGVVGHVDHGKTALVRALTGIDTDRLEEERRRGISIVLGFAPLDLGAAGGIDLIDMPGHERFVRTMIGGATGSAALLLVLAANEGVKPQTLEHLAIARLLGIRRGVVALTKRDLVDAATAARRTEAALALAAENGLEPPQVIETSAVTGLGIESLRQALATLLAAAPTPEEHGFFYLPVDRAFAAAGFGAVVTGTLRRGRIAVGDEVEVMPGALRARVRQLQAHGATVDAAAPGRRLAVNLRGLRVGDLARGCALLTPGMATAGCWLDVAVELLASAGRPLASGESLRLLFGTAETTARLRLLDRPALVPGERAVAQLRCEQPVAAPARERFILRAGSPAATVGGGAILAMAPGRRRRDDAAVTHLQALAAAPAAAVAATLAEAGPKGCTPADLARLVGEAPALARRLAIQAGAVAFADGTLLHHDAVQAMERRALAVLDEARRTDPVAPGLPHERLRSALTGPVAAEVIARLVERGEIVHAQGLLRRKGIAPSPGLAARQAALLQAVETAFRTAGPTPPDPAEVVAGQPDRARALRELVRRGVLVRTVDRVQKRELVFHSEAVRQAGLALAAGFPAGTPFLLGEAARLLGISRKYCVPLLEHLDQAGLTRRHGDRRTVTRTAPLPPPTAEARDQP